MGSMFDGGSRMDFEVDECVAGLLGWDGRLSPSREQTGGGADAGVRETLSGGERVSSDVRGRVGGETHPSQTRSVLPQSCSVLCFGVSSPAEPSSALSGCLNSSHFGVSK